jgi:hypothetical protein
LKTSQVDIFEDAISIFVHVNDELWRVGTYYCYEKAKKELFTWLEKGMCAWMRFNGRKTQSRRLQKYKDRRLSSMETLG